MGNTYKRLDDKRIEIDGVIYTDGGSEPSAGGAPVYPSEYIGGAGVSNPTPSPTAPQAPSAAPATNPTNAANPSGYTYTPGSTAPVGGSAMDYATWLQGNTKYQAGVTREKAVKAAEADRQRAIVDAASAFDKSKVTYGANAERAASMGLQNSGYGEYLTGKAYATQRGEVQNANKVAGARKDEALYTEGQMNIQADQKYAADLLGIKEDQNNSYNTLYNSASNGASIESIMQDSRWGTLTKEQQTAISQATTANSFMTRLQAGESLDAIKGTPEWSGLTIDQQAKLQSFYDTKVKAETEERDAANATNFSNWLGAINSGEATLDQIKTIPGYNELPEDMKSQLQAAQSKIESEKNDTIAYNSIATDIKNGNLTSEALEADERFKAITDEALKSQLRSEARTKDKAKADEAHAEIFSEAIRNSENGDYTEENIESIPGWSGFSEIEKDHIRDTIEATAEAKDKAEKETRYAQLDNKWGMLESMTTAFGNGADYTTAYSDSRLDTLAKDGYISKDDAEEIKAERNALVLREIDTLISDGDIETGIEKIKAARDNLYISSAEAEEYGFKVLKKDLSAMETNLVSLARVFEVIQMKNNVEQMKADGLLSQPDYEAAIRFIETGSYEAIPTFDPGASNTAGGTSKEAEKPLQSATTDGSLEDLNERYSEKSYSFSTNGNIPIKTNKLGSVYLSSPSGYIERSYVEASNEMQEALKKYAPGATLGDVVSDGKTQYIYAGGKWIILK